MMITTIQGENDLDKMTFVTIDLIKNTPDFIDSEYYRNVKEEIEDMFINNTDIVINLDNIKNPIRLKIIKAMNGYKKQYPFKNTNWTLVDHYSSMIIKEITNIINDTSTGYDLVHRKLKDGEEIVHLGLMRHKIV